MPALITICSGKMKKMKGHANLRHAISGTKFITVMIHYSHASYYIH